MLPSSEKINMKEVETMFYDVTKDPAAVEAVKNASPHTVSTAKIMEAFRDAEPERQLVIISFLEVSTGELLPLEKEDAVKRLLSKMEAAEQ